MNIRVDEFRVERREEIDLDRRPTKVADLYRDKDDCRRRLAAHVDKMRDLQSRLYADDRHALLFIFQAMDAAGKDGAIKHVMSGLNPQGCRVHSFKHPSAEELDHDFLWRSTRELPARGMIGIFNRSYYEEVLIVRVRPEILNAQKLPAKDVGSPAFWRERFRSIRAFERHLGRNGTRIVKIFLHMSKEEQRKRFLDRIDEPAKNWKFGSSDMSERGRFDDYMRAYEACFSATSTASAPWFVVPADDKENARLIVSQIVLDAMTALKPRYPEISEESRKSLATARAKLLAEAP